MPRKDIWQVSELGQSTFCSAHQVGQTAALSSSTIIGEWELLPADAGHAHEEMVAYLSSEMHLLQSDH